LARFERAANSRAREGSAKRARMNAILILNDHAGSIANGNDSGLTSQNITDTFAAAGITIVTHRATGPEMTSAIRAAMEKNPDAIFVGGGDGTVSTAAGLLVETGIPLGILPLGTLNHFARDLGLPGDWCDAVNAQTTAQRRAVDVGEVNGRVFINNCSLGSYAQAVRQRDALQSEHGHGKWRAMLVASIAVFRALRRLRLQIEMPATSLALRTPFVVISNNQYSGRVFGPSLRPRLDAGLLWLYTTRAKRRTTMLRLVLQTLLHRIDETEALETHAMTETVITTKQSALPIAADGEVIDVEPPLRFRIRPAALHVLAPSRSKLDV